MKTILLIILLSIAGGSVYLYFNTDLKNELINRANEVNRKIHETSKRAMGEKIEPIRLNREVNINLKRKVIDEIVIDEEKVKIKDKSEIQDKVDLENKKDKTVQNPNSPYISVITGKASVVLSQPDRLLIDGKMVRLFKIAPIKYAYMGEELKIIAEGREVSCGIMMYSTNNVPYGVCFVKSGEKEININYHLIENGYASYIK